jgi:lantibiotic modifying enzyme
MEFVETRACRSVTEGRLFYRRAGAMLLLAHLSGAVDFHRGNLIAAGASPVIIDAEALAHPCYSRPTGKGAIAGLARTGLLPGAIQWHAFDSSRRPSRDKHRPRVGAEYLCASDFVPELMQGFQLAARAIYSDAQRRRRCVRICSQIRQGEWRRILRPTSAYATIRRWSVEPDQLRDGLKRHLAILERSVNGEVPFKIALAETAALARFDIPLFTGMTLQLKNRFQGNRLPTLDQLRELGHEIKDSWA